MGLPHQDTPCACTVMSSCVDMGKCAREHEWRVTARHDMSSACVCHYLRLLNCWHLARLMSRHHWHWAFDTVQSAEKDFVTQKKCLQRSLPNTREWFVQRGDSEQLVINKDVRRRLTVDERQRRFQVHLPLHPPWTQQRVEEPWQHTRHLTLRTSLEKPGGFPARHAKIAISAPQHKHSHCGCSRSRERRFSDEARLFLHSDRSTRSLHSEHWQRNSLYWWCSMTLTRWVCDPGQKKRPLRLCIKSEHCSYHAISAWSAWSGDWHCGAAGRDFAHHCTPKRNQAWFFDIPWW